jgi:hypothetical protein
LSFDRRKKEEFRDLLIAVLKDDEMRSGILHEMKIPPSKLRLDLVDLWKELKKHAEGRLS